MIKTKTIIINGSPRKNGDTAFLISELKKYLQGDVIEISAFRDNISPCIDCRYCWTEGKCAIKDDMQIIYEGDYDNVIIASPIHMFGLPGPLVNLASRFQAYYAAKYIANKEIGITPKKGAFILVGGGNGKTDHAIKNAKFILRNMGAAYDENSFVLSLNTDKVPASQDTEALEKIRAIADDLSNNNDYSMLTKKLHS